jgi:hypothetical protein
VTGILGRRSRKLLDDLTERRGYSILEEESLDRTMWRAGFERGFEPLVRQTAKWMAHALNIKTMYKPNHTNSHVIVSEPYNSLQEINQEMYNIQSPRHRTYGSERLWGKVENKKQVVPA